MTPLIHPCRFTILLAVAILLPVTGHGRESPGFKPLTEMAAADRYKGQDGGLYGAGRNEPPADHLKAALREAAKIQPRGSDGKPSPDGNIAMISVGMSNTTQEFQPFARLARSDPTTSPLLLIVDGAQGGQDASSWAQEGRRGRDPWRELDRRLEKARVTASQVQVAWIKQARAGPSRLGEFPGHAEVLRDNMITILQRLRTRFPNLRIAYLSSRIYAGYATTELNPEPYAYESAFSVRGVIQAQIRGDESLNYDSRKGAVKAPLVLWGPYLWADGLTPRKADGMVWRREDLARDGTHPSRSGREKVARLLLRFFGEDPTSTPWFTGREEGFVPLFDGETLNGWQGATEHWAAERGSLVFIRKGAARSKKELLGLKLMSTKEYSDFVLRFDIKLPKGSNNGVAIRAPLEGDPAFAGMEIQVQDPQYYRKLKNYEVFGSVYGVVPAKTGHLKPNGQWNTAEIFCVGKRVKVTLNGTVIVEADLDSIGDKTLDGANHPGLKREKGLVGFCGHTGRVEFRSIRIRDLSGREARS